MTDPAISLAHSEQGERLLLVDVQNALQEHSAFEAVSNEQLNDWANLAYSSIHQTPNEVTIRLVDLGEITQLNREYRNKDKPTNVLSFPFESDFEFLEIEEEFTLLGDIVICHAVIVEEANEQSKPIADHYAHMVVHGILHLCGYDHQDDASAEKMEALEAQILAKRNIANPYL